ncbi:MAG: cytosine permease [Clostridium sp.]|nr:cytosine permease [Clostridium sp.]
MFDTKMTSEKFELSVEEARYLKQKIKVSEDILPTKISERKWGIYSVCACWIGMNVCIPAYQMASSAIAMGIDWGMALFLVLLGNLLILIPIQLNSYVGLKYGISFPVYAKLSFGIRGAVIPTVLRTVIGLFWTGILMWNGGESLYVIVSLLLNCKGARVMGICFLIVWILTVVVGYGGERILRCFEGICAPILILIFLTFFIIIAYKLEQKGIPFYEPLAFRNTTRDIIYWKNTLACLIANISYYSTWALNIPDLSRYVKNVKSQATGQLLGMPSSMLFIAFIGIYVTSASRILFGEAIWNPNQVVTLLGNEVLTLVFATGILLATMTTNVTTNLLPSSNGILSLFSKKQTHRSATILAGVIALAIQPWRLVADPSGYIYNWLGMYGILTGPVASIFIIDYFLVKHQSIKLLDLYISVGGKYWYSKGYNYKAILAWLLAVLPSAIGFIYEPWSWLAKWGWVTSFIMGAVLYFMLNIENKQGGKYNES